MSRQRFTRTMLASLAIGMFGLSACRDTDGEGGLFEVGGRLFVFNYRVATVHSLVNLTPLQPMREGDVAVATFENPAGGDPLVVREKIWPQNTKLTIESPPLECVVKDRPYAVTIRIEGADGAVRQTIETTVTSSQDQSMLPDRPLVVGPMYTANPDLAGHPDGKLPGGRGVDCPKAS